MNVLIIEDEKRNFNRLRRLLQEIDYTINVDGPTASVDETADYLSSHTPDLILADIRLTDGLSFDALERTDVQSPVIFITAYDEYAIRAFKYNGIDYLLKPVDPDELAAAVDKARRMRRQATEDNMRQLIEQMRRGGYRWRERFLLPGGVIIGRVLVCLGVCFHVLFFTCLPAYSVVSELQV
jgi:two-component system response regulator LytT